MRPDPDRFPLIPWPRSIEPRDGQAAPGTAATVETDAQIDAEGYRLDVGERGIRIAAADDRGVRYARQALRQLTRDDGSIPAVRIDDAPRFAWRGLHLDVSRHFFPVSFIKRYIDLLATYRLNVFHWHLTDDQGWRLEIKSRPRLTEVGARRRETVVGRHRVEPVRYDATPHAGFYTQDEVRDVVAYARERHVDVLPEIEFPGHSTAALAAYPKLACGEPPTEARTTWGISEVVYCPTDATFAFLEDVLGEVADLFPFGYIHIGGDEAPKTRWRQCREAQEVMRREGLRDEDHLQSWSIGRAGKLIEGLGRKMIGWDEILEGGLAPHATVMSWRGTEGGIAAARMGHDVVMSPEGDLYFDHYQGDPASEPLAHGGVTELEDVYRHEPVPAELSAAEAGRVLGPQACVWTEFIATPEHVEYMAYPRALALAEIGWSGPERDLAHFRARLERESAWLDARRVAYSRSWRR
ncbi:MAG TPA: beta-N-acetylhexosaminidase [Candidatus Limnocylindria bacterium]